MSILILTLFIQIEAQNRCEQCYAVDGSTDGIFGDTYFKRLNSNFEYCPNYPNTRGCVYFFGSKTIYMTYNMSKCSNIMFSIDYEIDAIYNYDDDISIYYNCGNGNILGLMISLSNNNAEMHKPYKNTSFNLSILCNYKQDITITVTQSGNHYFNFENACLTGYLTNNPTNNPTSTQSINPTSFSNNETSYLDNSYPTPKSQSNLTIWIIGLSSLVIIVWIIMCCYGLKGRKNIKKEMNHAMQNNITVSTEQPIESPSMYDGVLSNTQIYPSNINTPDGNKLTPNSHETKGNNDLNIYKDKTPDGLM